MNTTNNLRAAYATLRNALAAGFPVDHYSVAATVQGAPANVVDAFEALLGVSSGTLAALIAHPVGDFTVVMADDGSEQWAYKGRPLFTYRGDELPVHARGADIDPRWQVALVARYFMPQGVIIRTNLGFGTALANANGTALYIRDGFRFQVGNRYKRDA